MKDLLDKLSSYNIFNYLLPGVLFAGMSKSVSGYDLVQENLLVGVFVYYFIGMVISRLGSLLVEPLLKKARGRPELPHLTISFGNSSGEIDIHLTFQGVKKKYKPLATFDEGSFFEALSRSASDFKQIFIDRIYNLRPISIQYLVDRRYRIVYCPPDKVWDLIDLIAPQKRKKGNWRRAITEESATAFEAVNLRSYVYRPSYLRDLELSPPKDPIFAFRPRNRRDPQIIPLMLAYAPAGYPVWLRLDDFLSVFEADIAPLMARLLCGLVPEGISGAIENALRLDEIQSVA